MVTWMAGLSFGEGYNNREPPGKDGYGCFTLLNSWLWYPSPLSIIGGRSRSGPGQYNCKMVVAIPILAHRLTRDGHLPRHHAALSMSSSLSTRTSLTSLPWVHSSLHLSACCNPAHGPPPADARGPVVIECGFDIQRLLALLHQQMLHSPSSTEAT
jgi:hypothetical protein